METRVQSPEPDRGGSVFPCEPWERTPPTPDAAAGSPSQYVHASALSARYTKLASWLALLRFPPSNQNFLQIQPSGSSTGGQCLFLSRIEFQLFYSMPIIIFFKRKAPWGVHPIGTQKTQTDTLPRIE